MMDATVLPIEPAKWKSLTYRAVYRLLKATAMSLVIGFIAGREAGFYLFMLILALDSIEDSFSKSCKKCGVRISVISLLCVLIVSSLLCVIVQGFFRGDKMTIFFIAFMCSMLGTTCIDVVAVVNKTKDAN
jgi:hypothetical protein